MSSKILLINFSEKEVEKLKTLPLAVDRGFLSNINKELHYASSFSRDNDEDMKPVDDIDFYSPFPIYEYKVIFINLNRNQALEKEFDGRTVKLTDEDRKDFTKYWLSRGSPIIFFLGDYSFRNLSNFGVPQISLKQVVNNDVAVNSSGASYDKEMAALFNEIKSEVNMPTDYYIDFDKGSSFLENTSTHKAKYLYWNNNVENLAVFIDYDEGYSPHDRPRILLLPQFKANIKVAERFLRQLAKTFPKYLPELPHSEWVDSDEYYPSEVGDYDKAIDAFVADAQTKIQKLKGDKEAAKEKYKSLRGLITQTGNELKNSVIDILGNIFEVSVEDADKKTNTLPNEDITIDFQGTKMLAEIKGVKAENPSPLFIGQIWKHISQSKDKNITRGVLILNHDLETNPEDRSLAYKGEHEKGLEGIIFIDTRVMFYLGLAVIDHGMPPKEAAAKLFQDGRVGFDLDEWIESKNS